MPAMSAAGSWFRVDLYVFSAAFFLAARMAVLPLHGGPPLRSPRTRAVRQQIHRILRQVIDRGRADGTIKQDVTPREIVVFGAMLAQPRGPDPGWDTTCRRLLATYLAGLGTPAP